MQQQGAAEESRFVMDEHRITINTYHEYMCEAFAVLRLGLNALADAKAQEEDDHVTNWLWVSSGMQCRFAFLLAANALEAAANAMLLGLELSTASYTDLEKLPTLLKIETFCLAKGRRLERGNVLYTRVKDVVKCRNEFVHPKPTKISAKLNSDATDVELQIPKTSTRQYPTSFSLFEPDHAITAFRDILAFLSWVVVDICKIPQREVPLLLGYNSYGSSGDVSIVGEEYGFDLRTFNNK